VSPRIAVLLSTYNGAEFLDAQLESLAAQDGVEVEVFARDDGSTDATCEILGRWADRWPALAGLRSGPNFRPAMSFLTLLASAPEGFDGYAFCDQDDVWPRDKLARAAKALAARLADQPALYCARAMCVDAALNPIGPAPLKDKGDFEHLVFENIAFGATVVMNAAARRLVKARPPRTGVIMHDWWCALATSAFGAVVYDPQISLLYRQHGGNEIGQRSGRLAEIRRQARIFFRDPGRFWPIHAQAAEFLRLWGEDLAPARRRYAEALVRSKDSLAKRFGYAAFGRIRRSTRISVAAARALIALGLY
jgi:glycosyltransferase involved in cell wall biosynthesis